MHDSCNLIRNRHAVWLVAIVCTYMHLQIIIANKPLFLPTVILWYRLHLAVGPIEYRNYFHHGLAVIVHRVRIGAAQE